LKNLDFIEAAFKYLKMSVSIEGKENLPPKDGRYIFACNHPLGGLDGIAAGYLIGKSTMVKVRFFERFVNVSPSHERNVYSGK